jgi:GrpB-like predicted nucleotidyltransferase (UPF0157 family)
MDEESVTLSEYNPQWPVMFEQEKAFLNNLLGKWVIGSIEHVGSTAMPGMVAKPIIDIMVGVQSLEASRSAIEVLSNNGYCFYPYKADVMHWFCKPSPHKRTHHLHLIPFESPLWHERITFRDHLRANPLAASDYAALKTHLAQQHNNDRELYTQKKWPFIKGIITNG